MSYEIIIKQNRDLFPEKEWSLIGLERVDGQPVDASKKTKITLPLNCLTKESVVVFSQYVDSLDLQKVIKVINNL